SNETRALIPFLDKIESYVFHNKNDKNTIYYEIKNGKKQYFLLISSVYTYLSLVLSQSLLSYSTLIMLMRISPFVVATDTFEATSLPSRLVTMGESLEIFPSNGSASALPTIVYVSSSPSGSSLKVTDFPKVTTLESLSSFSIMTALRIIFSICEIRLSTKACSSLAASYSEFSDKSPNPRAIFIRSTTSCRRFVFK